MLALMDSYVCCMQLALSVAFRFGRRLFRWLVPIANLIKPMLSVLSRWQTLQNLLFVCVYSYGKRYKTNVFLLFRCFFCVIAMANAITPVFVFVYCDGRRYNTTGFLYIAMANVIKPMFCFIIVMANVIQPMFFFIAMTNDIKPMLFRLLRWQTV